MIINLDEKMYIDTKQFYTNSVLNIVEKNFDNKQLNDPDNKIFIHLKKEMLETIIINPFSFRSKIEYSFLESYFKVVLLNFYNHEFFKFIWKINEEEFKKNGIGKNNFFEICRYYSVKEHNNPLIKKVIEKNRRKYIKNNNEYKQLLKEINEEIGTLDNGLKSIFVYEMRENNDKSSESPINTEIRTEILRKIGVNVCPYCNRQFINSYDIYESKRVIAQMDHFIPKKKYPLYALTLFNFIPSCSHCNSILKKEISFPTSIPINNLGNTAQFFSVEFTNYKDMVGQSDKVSLSVLNRETNLLKKYAKEMELYNFATESIYSYHNYFSKMLMEKKQLYNESYKRYIQEILDRELTEEDFREIIFGYKMTPEEFYSKPLSKLAYDIINF